MLPVTIPTEPDDLIGPLPGMVFGRLDRSGGGLLGASAVKVSEQLEIEAQSLAIDCIGYKPEKAYFDVPAFAHVQSKTDRDIYFLVKIVPTPSVQQPCRLLCPMPFELYRRLGCSPFAADAAGFFNFAEQFLTNPKKGLVCPPAFGSLTSRDSSPDRALPPVNPEQISEIASIMTVLQNQTSLVIRGSVPSAVLNRVISMALLRAGPEASASVDLYTFRYTVPEETIGKRPLLACVYSVGYEEERAYARQLPNPSLETFRSQTALRSSARINDPKPSQDPPNKGESQEVGDDLKLLRASVEVLQAKLNQQIAKTDPPVTTANYLPRKNTNAAIAIATASVALIIGIAAMLVAVRSMNDVKSLRNTLDTRLAEKETLAKHARKKAHDLQVEVLREIPTDQRLFLDADNGFLTSKANAEDLILSVNKQDSRLSAEGDLGFWKIEPTSPSRLIAVSFGRSSDGSLASLRVSEFRLTLARSKKIFALWIMGLPGESPRIVGLRRLEVTP
jgi:hypothetical protein